MKKPIWQNHYVNYKYVNGLDREIIISVEIEGNMLSITNEYTCCVKNYIISDKTVNDIINGKISPFSNEVLQRQGYVTIWKDENFEIRENKGLYRLRKHQDKLSELGTIIPKTVYEMIRDGIIDPDHYMERIEHE